MTMLLTFFFATIQHPDFLVRTSKGSTRAANMRSAWQDVKRELGRTGNRLLFDYDRSGKTDLFDVACFEGEMRK